VLTRDPDFAGERRLVLLTLGSNLPAISFDPEAKWARNRLRQLAVAPQIDWIDVQSPDDALIVCPFDPVADPTLGLDTDERRNPAIISVRFRDLRKTGTFSWRLAWSHGQYLRANERPGAAFDFYLLCCGPLDAKARLTASPPAQ
jgi:hypothetical protein